MKTILTIAIALGLLGTASLTVAEDTKVVTTTSTGTITEYVPGTTFVVKESSGPVTYRYGTKVAYVTKSGVEIPEAELKTRIRVGAPVSVHYSTEGENRVVTRVVVDD